MTRTHAILLLLVFHLNFFSQSSYFQQEVNYKIEVELNDKTHFLNGKIQIEYINNSSDTLNFIYIHLWPNAYKNNRTALAKQLRENGNLIMDFMTEKESGWIDSIHFESSGNKLSMEYNNQHPDIGKLILNKPLLPKTTILLSTPFRVKIPSAKISRLGHIGQAYAISQWYPKPAVFDRNGWHPMSYLDQGEFYSEFGCFEVKITLPENYVVGATGDLTDNEDEINWLNEKVKTTQNKIKIREELKKLKTDIFTDSIAFPHSSKNKKTLTFKQKNIHDFAWFADKRFNVLKSEVTLPESKRKVVCWSMFTGNNFDLWLKSPEYLQDAIYYYSLWNGDYAYQHVTAVDGTISAGGGMEYPNVTIIGEAQNDFELENVIMHEVGHNWFYGMLGNNERCHAWMDEGINSFNELRYMRTKYPNARLGALFGLNPDLSLFGINRFKNAYQYYLLYAKSAFENNDQPIEWNSELFTEGNYGAIVYSKTAIVMDYLFHYLGELVFDNCMRTYFTKYKFKHPEPDDLRKVFETVSGKDLSWFFNDIIQSVKKVDYKIKSVKEIKQNPNSSLLLKYQLKIKNKGEIMSPILIAAKSKDSITDLQWVDGFAGTRLIELNSNLTDEFMIDPNYIIPETNRKNNHIRTSGWIKKRNPFKIRFAGTIDSPNMSELNYLPVMGYNHNNGWMTGVNISNYFILEKRFQYDFTPMYAFKNKSVAGFSNLQFNFHPHKIFRTINSGIKAKRFAYDLQEGNLNYYKIEQYNSFTLKNKNPRSKIENLIKLRLNHIGIEYLRNTSIIFNGQSERKMKYRSIAEIILAHYNRRSLHPYSLQVHWQTGNDDKFLFNSAPFSKIWFEANFHYTTNQKNNGFDLRFFAGKSFATTDNADTRFRMGGIHGNQDYAFDYLFIDRNANSGINYQQYLEADGAFKTRMFIGQSNQYLLAINIKSPKIIRTMGLFADFGTCGKDGLLNDKILSDFGINFDFFNQAVCIYLPLLYSKDIRSGIIANGWSFGERIMINFRIDKLNPKSYIRSLFDFQ